ncbi:hypothetical protein EW145_g6488 [Phellinidium pouzarii]|uniref:SAP domain-containing protein n=1 Tax=Phellinidium pouzarii TaxID=167371 RepID=A0A4S4L162_9AGAM|nr:hypothetical protein EW145_g6488 [Phellinidium pouzarii]
MSLSYSGSLQIKKKAELQEISQALGISDAGTREELQQRIKKHLDDYSTDLEGDPAFSGLYARKRQRSLQPQGLPQPSRFRSSEPSRFSAIPEERGFSPGADDLYDVSMMLPRAPLSPAAPSSLPLRNASLSPSSLPPLPPSPAKSIIADDISQPEVQATVKMEWNVTQALFTARVVLSSGRNIFIISALLDFISIIFTIHGNSYYPVPSITNEVEPVLQATAWVTVHWAIPSLVLPAIFGYFISFSTPAFQLKFDVLTASIVRVAANVAYPFPSMVFIALSDEIQSLDVLGVKWRLVSATVTLAFAFAEAIGRSSIKSSNRAGDF